MNPRIALLGLFAVAILMVAGDAAFGQQANEQRGGTWMPPSASTYGPNIDFMYEVIFWITTVTFVLVEGLLLLFCVLYRRRPGHRPQYTHGSNTAELAWTVTPAIILLGLAIWQIPAWNLAKKEMPRAGDPGVLHLQSMAEQFKWHYRYPLTKKQVEDWESEYDQVLAAQMHVPFGDKILMDLRSKDVIHSFFVPAMRVKQDAVPGLRNRVWFEPSRTFVIKLDPAGGPQSTEWVVSPKDFESGGLYYDKRIALSKYSNKIDQVAHTAKYEVFLDAKTGKPQPVRVLHQGKILEKQEWSSCHYAMGVFEIACAELCGLGHYTMSSQLVVEPRVAYEAWLKEQVGDDPKDGVWKRWHE